MRRPRRLPALLPALTTTWLLAAVGAAAAAPAPAAPPLAAPASGATCARAWPAWDAFQAGFLRSGGRVLDPSSPQAQTVSEGQAYALFFALVQDDRAGFERLLRWTEDNLAGGDLSLRLPAWQWGRRGDGSYGIIDDNSAADADLWLTYALGEAGRLWNERRYRALSSLLADRIVREETAPVPGLGQALLPGAHGFAPVGGRWRFNPSYAPPFLMQWFATRSTDPRWLQLRATALRVLREPAAAGFAPDWAHFREAGATAGAGGFERSGSDAPAPAERIGGYDAIRVYLWLGMTAPQDPERAALLRQFAPMADLVERTGVPPAAVDAASGVARDAGPPGFAAALLPFLAALGRDAALRTQQQRLQAQPAAADAYYDQVLGLFGQGWSEGRFRFGADGGLLLPWQTCAAGTLAAPAAPAP